MSLQESAVKDAATEEKDEGGDGNAGLGQRTDSPPEPTTTSHPAEGGAQKKRPRLAEVEKLQAIREGLKKIWVGKPDSSRPSKERTGKATGDQKKG
jgi:hypothetical protein